MARRRKVDLPRPELNITAMMDLVLNLITFFVLVANFASETLPNIQMPAPDHSVAHATEAQRRLAVTVESDPADPSKALRIQVGLDKFKPTDLKDITALLRAQVQKAPGLQVDLRGDKRLRYDQVSLVMQAIANAGITTINLVAESPAQ